MLTVIGLTCMVRLAAAHTGAHFDGDRLIRPERYREWIFVGSSLGLSYVQTGLPANAELYHNVYIQPRAFNEYRKTGRFPEGTMMVQELATSESKRDPALQGSYQAAFVGLEASVKDSRRFKEGWGYFVFSGGSKTSAARQPAATCWQCHHDHSETDHVFTQFYPVLRR
jgi:hypothetical protein